MNALVEGSLWFPSDEDVRNAFVNYGFYGSIGQARLRPILSAIDVQMRNKNLKVPTGSFNYNTLQIEHIMPQKWDPHWLLAADVSADDSTFG